MNLSLLYGWSSCVVIVLFNNVCNISVRSLIYEVGVFGHRMWSVYLMFSMYLKMFFSSKFKTGSRFQTRWHSKQQDWVFWLMSGKYYTHVKVWILKESARLTCADLNRNVRCLQRLALHYQRLQLLPACVLSDVHHTMHIYIYTFNLYLTSLYSQPICTVGAHPAIYLWSAFWKLQTIIN